MKIVLKGFKVDNDINYKIVSIDKCCDKILNNPVIDINKIQGNTYNEWLPAVTLKETIYYFDYEDTDTSYVYHQIFNCPFCGESIEIFIDEIIDVTEDYHKIQAEANKYYIKANKSNSKKRESELCQKEHQISKILNWWLTTESWKQEKDEYED